jgi:hypothetical protein
MEPQKQQGFVKKTVVERKRVNKSKINPKTVDFSLIVI